MGGSVSRCGSPIGWGGGPALPGPKLEGWLWTQCLWGELDAEERIIYGVCFEIPLNRKEQPVHMSRKPTVSRVSC